MWRTPQFWEKRGLLSALLMPFAVLYGWAVRRYQKRSPHKVNVPVICVGNITVGGAGKTPTALFLARQLQEMDETVFILTRGFGGKIRDICRVDRAQHDAAMVGDEALMMAVYAPVIVGADRVAAARLAVQQGADVIIMDDGFQNPYLHKDFSLIVIDGSYGLGNGCVMPAGPLRERPQDALARADAVIVIGGETASTTSLPEMKMPVFRAEIRAREQVSLSQPMIAFAGIGRPEKFFALLTQMNADLAECHSFADHHIFREKDAVFLLERAARLGAKLITTEKDMARLARAQLSFPQAPQLAKLAQSCDSLPVELAVRRDDEKRIKLQLQKMCNKR